MPPRSQARSARAAPTARSAPSKPRLEFPHHRVTAVLVAHDGARWLPEALAALQWQRRPPQQIRAVDTGSTDDSRAVLERELGADAVLPAPADTGFGAAVALALARDPGPGATSTPPDGRSRRGGGTDDDQERGDETGDEAGDEAGTRPDGALGAPAPPRGAPVEWVWLLHDDCAPSPDALRTLLELAEASPSAAVVGPKAVAWDEPGVLVEVGFTVDPSGRRETGLDRGELDQGQHDRVRDVLAVGSAGALVRRDVWDSLGGYDPALPLFRDDLDFCWRANLAGHRVVVAPRAVIRHAAAGSSGERRLHATPDRPGRVDRAHALYTLLADLSGPGLPWTALRLVLGSLLRTLGFVVAKRFRDAADELLALGSVLGRPDRVLAARRRRAPRRRVPYRAVRHLLARRSARLRMVVDATAGWLGERLRGDVSHGAGAAGLETGPSAADEDFDAGSEPWVRRLLLRPGPLLLLALVVLALVADRALLGSGALGGGRLLPTPEGASDLWSAYGAGWHSVGVGSDTTAPPYLAGLGVLAVVLLGKAWLATAVLMLGCVPLAGATAYYAIGRVTRVPALRVWGAATYALLPVGTGAVAGGRLGDVVGFVLVPLVLVAVTAVLRGDPRFDGWRPVWGSALLVAFGTAFAPQLYLVVLPALLAWVVVVRLAAPPAAEGSAVRSMLAAALVAGLPLALLWPWTADVVTDPALLLSTPGPVATGLGADELRPSLLLLAFPGGVGTPPWWLTLPLLLAAASGLLRVTRRRLVRGAWALALLALAVGILVAHSHTSDVTGAGTVPGWPGIPAAVVGAALITAAVVAGEGARRRLERMSFGWRQPLAATVALAAAAVPIAAGVSWAVRGADDPLTRVTESAVPAFVAAEAETGARPRLLAITPAAGGAVSYALVRGAGPQLGDADRAPTGREDPLGRVVSALVSGTGASVAGALATYGIGYVLLPAEADGDLVAVLNATEGLARSSNADAPDLWEVTAPAGELVVLPPRLGERARAGVAPPVGALLASPPIALEVAAGRTAEVPPGRDGRLLVLAESSDPGWRAEIGGRRLDPLTTWGWAQGFVLPADGGTVRVWHAGGGRTTELVVQGALVALVALLAWPTLGRSDRPPRPRSRRRPPTPAVAAPREPASVGATDGAA